MTKREKQDLSKVNSFVLKIHGQVWRFTDEDHIVETNYDARLCRHLVQTYAAHEQAIAAAKSALASRYFFRRPIIHRPPGTKLNAIASNIFSKRTYERVLKPYLAEAQYEYFEALKEGKPSKARWVRVRSVLGFWWTVFLQLPVSLTRLAHKIWTLAG